MRAMADDEIISSEFFERNAKTLWRQETSSKSTATLSRRFRSYFGTSSKVCCFLLIMIKGTVPSHSQPAHLLWGLLFFKNAFDRECQCEYCISG